MGQTTTGKFTEQRVRERLKNLGLDVYKPIPDRGVDLIAHFTGKPESIVKIQVKGRNPKTDTNLLWFQIRVSPTDLKNAVRKNITPDQAWEKKIDKADFFVLDAVKAIEMWVLSRKQIYDLIKLNENKYASRLDNIFNFEMPLKQKQKEMNLDIEVNGIKLTEIFRDCKDNYGPILDFLKNFDRITFPLDR